jgi:1,4-dihydroxy-2-naphthoyl-CoA synthase
MTDYKEILYEKQRGGVLITLNRPEALNAITRSMLKELHEALDEAEEDPEIRAIVLTGAGRGFCSGFDQATTSGRRRDMQWPQGMPTDMSSADLLNYWRKDDAKLMHIFELTKPVIAANVRAISDVVRNDENGITVPFGDVWRLAAAVRRLINDRTLADSLASRGEDLVQQMYQWPEVLSRVDRAYEAAMSSSRSATA